MVYTVLVTSIALIFLVGWSSYLWFVSVLRYGHPVNKKISNFGNLFFISRAFRTVSTFWNVVYFVWIRSVYLGL